jgi:non-heme chloroperoxidase
MTFCVARDGTRLFYKDWGAGRPVVFVPSWALNADMWAYQMAELTAEGLRCVAYDRRGHGRSDQPGHGYDYDTLADDLAALLEHLDLRGVTLVGHSMGGGEVVRYLSRHGAARVARAVLLAPTTPFLLRTPDNPEGVEGGRFEELRAAWRRDFPGWLAENAPGFFGAGRPGRPVSPETVRWALGLIEQTPLEVALDCHRAMAETDFRAEPGALAVPTLVIHGDADLSAPLGRTGQASARLLPGGRLEVYEGAPHGLFVTDKDRLNRDLLAFVRA